ncbi:MAG: sigma-70 family RNA polymerase sigma factor [Acidimicrobiia bacterium]
MRTRTRPAPLAHEDGIRAAYAAHGNELYRAARRLTGDAHHAEELVQETFLRAWRAADRFDEQLGSLRTWLFGILRNLAIDHARAEAVRPLRAVDPAVLPPADESTADEIDRVLLAWQVEEALGRLGADHRRVLVEVHLRGRAIADVAAELGVPGGTVKSRVYYALRALRVTLEELGWSEAGMS